MRSAARRLRGLGAALAALLAPAPLAAQQAATGGPVRVFFDNDFLGPGQSNIQAMIPLLRDSRVRLEGVGVTPTIEVPFPLEYAAGNDPQIDKAVEVLTRQIGG